MSARRELACLALLFFAAFALRFACVLQYTSAHPHAAALMIDWMLSEGQEILVAKFGRNSTTPGLKHLFPELVRSKYLVVNPEKFGPQYADYTRWYCEIFRSC